MNFMPGKLQKMNPMKRRIRQKLRQSGIGKPIERDKLFAQLLSTRSALLRSADNVGASRAIANGLGKELGSRNVPNSNRALAKRLIRNASHSLAEEQQHTNALLSTYHAAIEQEKGSRKSRTVLNSRLIKAGPFVLARLARTKGKVLLGGKE